MDQAIKSAEGQSAGPSAAAKMMGKMKMKGKGKQPKVKKPRARNFTNDEVELIMRLSGSKTKILTARLSATVTSQKKKAVWQKITDTVNAANGFNDRSWTEVRKKWHANISSAKTKLRENAKQQRKTGGGPSEAQPLNAVEQMAVDSAAISTVHVEGIRGGFDTNTDRNTSNRILPDNLLMFVPETQPSQLAPTELRNDTTRSQTQHEEFPESASSPRSLILNLDNPPVTQDGATTADTIGEGLRAVYGSTLIGERDSVPRSPRSRADDDSGSEAATCYVMDSDSDSEVEQQSFRSLDNYEDDTDISMGEEDAPVAPASSAAPTPAAPAASTSAAPAAQPLRSNRTVTRDIRRTEFKELTARKDRLNELLAGTNVILNSILMELRKMNEKYQ